MNSDKLFATVVTTITVLFIVVVLIFVFTKKATHSRHFVSKYSDAVAVSLATPTIKRVSKAQNIKKSKSHTTHKKRYNKPKKRVVKRVKKKKLVSKRVVKKVAKAKEKATSKPKKIEAPKKPSIVKKEQKSPKKVEAKSLFSSINRNSTTSKKPLEGKGEINRYLAKVESILRGWPAQRNFAGEEIDVRLKIYPTGKFEYKIMKYSQNEEFNRALISYLDDLKRFGFGPHKANRAYEIEVKFVANE